MADDFATCPWSFFGDERLAEASLTEIAGAALVVMCCDDYGRFEGRARVLARRIGSTPDEVAKLLERLAEMGVVEFYEAATESGIRRVGEVIGFYELPGHPFRVANPSQRGAALYPDREGNYEPGRKARASGSEQDAEPKRGTKRKAGARPVQEKREKRARSVQVESKSGASDLARPRVDRAHSARASAQHSTAQQDPRATHSDQGAPPRRAPEPTPPASTDARERACALDAAPSPPGGHAPALGGAGSPPAEIPEGEPQPGREEQDPPPKPIPRRVRMTRDEELERMQALREQVASLGAT